MIWVYMGAFVALILFGIDFLLRRKKWNDNTPEEKKSLILNMALLPVYLFMAALGLFLGITGSGADTAFGDTMYEISLMLGAFNFIPGIIATVGSIVFRKLGKTALSKQIHYAALIYVALVMVLWIGSSFF